MGERSGRDAVSAIQVLLIDDDDDSRGGIAAFLRTVARFAVYECASGSEALEHLNTFSQNYTVVLLDVVLGPPISGEDVLAEIRATYPRLPVIVFTGRDPKGSIEALTKGAYAALQRPLDLIELKALILELAEQGMMLPQMAHDMQQCLAAEVCLAWRLDRREQHFHVVAWAGNVDNEYRRTVFLDAQEQCWPSSYIDGEPLFVVDVADAQVVPWYRYRGAARERGWISLISIPLVHQRRVIGLIDCYNTRQPSLFTNTEQQRLIVPMLQAYARQASESVRYADLAQSAQVLREIDKLLADTLDEATIIGHILTKGLELVGSQIGWLYLLDQRTGRLVRKQAQGLPEHLLEKERTVDEGITGRVAREGKAYYAPDVSRINFHKPLPGFEIRSEVAVPLRRREQTIGVLTVKSRFPNDFTDDDVDLLIALAAQASVAIDHAKLTKHAQEISRLALVEQFKDLADYVVAAAKDLTGADVNLWMLSDREGEGDKYARIVASCGDIYAGIQKDKPLPIEPGTSISSEAFTERKPVICDDIMKDSRKPEFFFKKEAKSGDWHSFMAVPLFGREGEPLGLLSLYGHTIAKFGMAQSELMQTFANQVAIALQQQKRMAALRQLAQVGQTLAGGIADDPKKLLEQAAEVACRLTKAQCAVIYPYHPVKKYFYAKEHIAAFGLHDPASGIADKPRDTGLTAWVRRLGMLAVHRIDPDHIAFDQATSDKVGSSVQEVVSRIREADFIRRERVAAFVGISLKAHINIGDTETDAEEVGVLYIDFRATHHFTREELQIIQIYAHYVANVIRGTNLYTEAQRQTLELDAVEQTALKIIAQGEHPDELLQALVEEATKLLKGKGGKVYLRVPGEERVQLVAAQNVDSTLFPVGSVLSFGEGMAGRVIESKRPLIVPNYKISPYRVERLAPLFGAVIEVPLLLEDVAIGVLTVFDDVENREFGDEDIRILTRLAQQAALSIHHANLYEEGQKRLKILDALQKTSLDIAQRLDFNQLLEVIVKRAAELIGGKEARGIGAAYWQCNYDSGKARIEHSTRSDFQNIEVNLHSGLIGKVISTGEAQYVNDYPHWAEHDQVLEEKGFISYMQNLIEAPVKADDSGKITAIIAITDATGDRPFTEADREVIGRFADIVAIAIQNARLVQREKTIREIASALSHDAEIAEVTKRILDELDKLVGFHKATVQLLEGDSRELIAYRGFSEAEIDPHLLQSIISDPLVSNVIDQKVPIIVPYTRRHPHWEFRASTADVLSWVGLPLVYNENVIGLITLDHREPGYYSTQLSDFLSLFGPQAAIAIQKARLFRRATRLGHLQEITATISAEPWNLDKVLRLIAGGLPKVFQGGQCIIRLYDAAADEYTRFVVTTASWEEVGINKPRRDGITRYVHRTRQPYFLRDTKAPPETGSPGIRDDVARRNVRALAALPLLSEGQIIGVLYHLLFTPHDFPESDRQVLKLFADQAVMAIKNAQLYEQEILTIHEIATSVSIAARDSLMGTLQKVARLTASLMKPDSIVSLLLLDPRSGELAPVVSEQAPPANPHTGRTKEKAGNTWDPDAVTKLAESRIVADIRQAPAYTPSIAGILSYMAAPLRKGDKTIGALYVEHHRVDAFSERDLKLVEAIAGLVVVANENNRLFDEQEDRAIRLASLLQVTTMISAAPTDLDDVLDLVVRSLSRIFADNECLIRLFEEGSSARIVKVVATNRLSPEERGFAPRTHGINRFIVTERRPYYNEDTLRPPPLELPPVREETIQRGVRAVAALPLLSEHEIIGILFLNLRMPHQFSQNDKQILELFAAQAAVAIRNARNIQAGREAQERAAEADKLAMLGQVGAEFVHRMNNLAGTIPVRVEMVKEQIDLGEPHNREIIRHLDHIQTDARELLQAARAIQLAAESSLSEFVQVNDLLQKAIERAFATLPLAGKRVEYQVMLADDLKPVSAERNRFYEALFNLISNAIQSMPNGGTLTVMTRNIVSSDRPLVQIEISDTGVGIAHQDIPLIFKLFYTTKVGGLGLGLWQVRTAIRALGGQIDVRSTEGQGTTFTITIPISSNIVRS
jgi:GAF domain-containing protein/ActR/RegA family two-component response regulator